MPEATVAHEIDTDEETFWKTIFFGEEFNKKLFEGHLKFPTWSQVEFKEDDAKITRRVRVDPPTGDLPGPMKKLIGDKFSYFEEGTYDKKTKRYSFKVLPSVLADKMKVSGEIWVEKISDNKIRRKARIEVQVKIFAVGGMVEDRTLVDVKKSYDQGAAFTNQFLKENRG